MPRVAHELIIGGAKSGKSRTAERRALDWLANGPQRSATLVATSFPGEVTGDLEMVERIARHRTDRALRIPALQTVEAPSHLGRTVRALDAPDRIILVDCLTLWLTQCLMPPDCATGDLALPTLSWEQEQEELLDALRLSSAPVVLVTNEIGLGVMPMSREARSFVDALGVLHQTVAERCASVTLMVAGCEWAVKRPVQGD